MFTFDNMNENKVSIGSVFKTIVWPRRKLLFVGLVLIIMCKYRQSSFNSILLNEVLFDNDKIRISIKEDMQYESLFL